MTVIVSDLDTAMMSGSIAERKKHFEKETSGADCYNSDRGKGHEVKISVMGETCEGWREKEDVEERLEGPENDRADAEWYALEDCRVGTSSRTFDRGNERLSWRGIRNIERTGSSGDRREIPREIVSEQSSRLRKKGGLRKVDSTWDESEEGKASVRGKRSREDDRRDRSRGQERGEGFPVEDSDDGSKVRGRRRGEDTRDYWPQIRNGAVEDWGDLEGATRPSSTVRIEGTRDQRIDRSRVRDRTESGREEPEDAFRARGRGGTEKGEDDWVETATTGGRERVANVSEEAAKFTGTAKVGNEAERGDTQRDSLGSERAEGFEVVPDNDERLGGRSRVNETLISRDSGDGGRDEPEDGGMAGGRGRGGQTEREPRSAGGRKDIHGDRGDTERDWIDDEDFGQGRANGRFEREKDRQRHFERERGHANDNDGPLERERRREWEEIANGRNDRVRDKYREGEDKERESAQDLDMKRERTERERSGREKIDRGIGDRERLERKRSEGLSGLNGMMLVNDSNGRGAAGVPLPLSMDPGGGILSVGLFFPRARGDTVLKGESEGESGDADWDGPAQQESVRGADGSYNDNRERHTTEDEPPPGLEQGLGPSPGRGGGNDGGMVFNLHGGRGKAKGSPSNRSRGAIIVHESRQNFANNLGSGLMNRGMQPGGRGGRGRGPGKVGRGGGRDGQRGDSTVISQMGPGLPGPLFGQLGPPGPIAGLGPGIMGPGAFPLPPFGGRMGWSPGGGDMGRMTGPPGPIPGPPRFGPGLGPGPPGVGPNLFFSSPVPVRGGPGPISLGAIFGGSSHFSGRPMPGERGPSVGRSAARGSGPGGRGASRGEQNDYSQHFVDTGLRPQNFIRDVELADRFEEYPKLKELIARKDKLIAERATPPMYMQCDLRTTELRPEVFGTKFDVILVDPPWEEYVRRAPGVGDSMEWWSHLDIQSLRIEAISDTPAFIFLWVGDAEGLDQGRVCLKKWGFRRCEDICWVKTNRENPTPALRHDASTILQHSKEHCLMGIKGTVRRSTDGHIIHANVDTDIMISEEPDYGSTAKPEELYHIIEHFAQGQRRIELFGEDHNIRAGWVTVGKGLSSSNFSPQTYAKHFVDGEGKVWQGGRGNPPFDAPHLVGTTSEIESLRPRSPPPRAQQQPQSHAAISVQSPGTNANSKRTSSISQGGLQIAPSIPSLVSGVGHATFVPIEASPAGNGGRDGGHFQVPKAAETDILHDMKPSGLLYSIRSDVVANEEQSFVTEVVELPCEVEAGQKETVSKSGLFGAHI